MSYIHKYFAPNVAHLSKTDLVLINRSRKTVWLLELTWSFESNIVAHQRKTSKYTAIKSDIEWLCEINKQVKYNKYICSEQYPIKCLEMPKAAVKDFSTLFFLHIPCIQSTNMEEPTFPNTLTCLLVKSKIQSKVLKLVRAILPSSAARGRVG